jgi:hypothetical protein
LSSGKPDVDEVQPACQEDRQVTLPAADAGSAQDSMAETLSSRPWQIPRVQQQTHPLWVADAVPGEPQRLVHA